MASIPRSLPPRPYATRPSVPRPYYGPPPARPAGAGLGASAALTSALGAIGGTLGCLLCLSAIGALGLFSCVVALTAYAKLFLDQYKNVLGLNSGIEQIPSIFVLLFATLVCLIMGRIQRN